MTDDKIDRESFDPRQLHARTSPNTLARIAGQQVAKDNTVRTLWYAYGAAGEGPGLDVTGDDAFQIVRALEHLGLLPPHSFARFSAQEAQDIDRALARTRNVNRPVFGHIRYRHPEGPRKQT